MQLLKAQFGPGSVAVDGRAEEAFWCVGRARCCSDGSVFHCSVLDQASHSNPEKGPLVRRI